MLELPPVQNRKVVCIDIYINLVDGDYETPDISLNMVCLILLDESKGSTNHLSFTDVQSMPWALNISGLLGVKEIWKRLSSVG